MLKKIFLIFTVFFICTAAYAAERIKADYNKKGQFYIYKIDLKELGPRIRPYIVKDGLKTAREVFKENDFDFVINGGFFDPVSAKSVSYVTINQKLEGSPFESMEMIENLNREGRIDNVLNRSEFRIYRHATIGLLKFDITKHFDPVPEGYDILHSLGGGPMLCPSFNLEEEGFVKYDETQKPVLQAAHVLKKRARTILALKKDYLYVIIFSNFAPVTMSEVNQKLKKYRFEKIMALDGGPSTSLNWEDFEIASSNNDQRKVKSFLIIQK